ncbi:MAG: hypothetical protein ACJ8HJ_17980 [Massilia sp.]
MNDANDVLGRQMPEYAYYEKHKPLLDLDFKKSVGGRVVLTMIIGSLIVLRLVGNGHGWWAIGVAVFLIGSIVEPVVSLTIDRVRIFRDGILATYVQFPWNGKPAWRQFPWSVVLHLDLSDAQFQIATTRESSSYGHVYSYMRKMNRKEKAKLINEFKSLQQRGDIPSTVRIVE